MTASDIATQGRPAGRPEGRQGRRRRRTVLRPLSAGRRHRLGVPRGLAREIGYEVAVTRRQVRLPQADRPRDDAPRPAAAAGTEPAGAAAGHATCCGSGRCVTSAEQVKEVEVRGWDVADEEGARRPPRRRRRTSAELPARQPGRRWPRRSATRCTSPPTSPYRTQAEVDAAAKALAEQIAGAFAEFEGVARGNPKLRAGAAVAIDNSARRSTASTPSPPPGTASTRPPATPRRSR